MPCACAGRLTAKPLNYQLSSSTDKKEKKRKEKKEKKKHNKKKSSKHNKKSKKH